MNTTTIEERRRERFDAILAALRSNPRFAEPPAPVHGSAVSRTTGCTIWSRATNDEGFPLLGGVIVDVVDVVDPETGEMVRSYKVQSYDAGRLVLPLLAEADVDPTRTEAASAGPVADAIRALCAEIAVASGSRPRLRKGAMSSFHAGLVAHVFHLAGVL